MNKNSLKSILNTTKYISLIVAIVYIILAYKSITEQNSIGIILIVITIIYTTEKIIIYLIKSKQEKRFIISNIFSIVFHIYLIEIFMKIYKISKITFLTIQPSYLKINYLIMIALMIIIIIYDVIIQIKKY